jgi:glycolate oxidase FAD binding subunit
MTLRPATIDALCALVPEHSSLQVRGGGTKPGLARPADGATSIDLAALAGVTEYALEECTFTALAGTRLSDIEELLDAHGQYLPFDPPLVDAGATIGGTVAAGVNGSRRLRYGGVRDFLIGARVVDGRGRLIRSGGKVVKNAAGFLLHQAMVGSCGRLGVLAELTFKVFPRSPAGVTLRVEAADLVSACATMTAVQRARTEVEALDLEAPSTVWIRLGGFADALPERIARLSQALGRPLDVLRDDADAAVWRQAREFAWAPADAALVRVALTTPDVPALDLIAAERGAPRRYALAGNLAFVAWPEDLEDLSRELAALGLGGQVLTGASRRPFIGAAAPDEFERRVRSVMDPDGRFESFE